MYNGSSMVDSATSVCYAAAKVRKVLHFDAHADTLFFYSHHFRLTMLRLSLFLT